MKFKFGLISIFIFFVVFTGCQRVQKVLIQENAIDQSDPVKVVWIINDQGQEKDIDNFLWSLCVNLLKQSQELVRVRYFTSENPGTHSDLLIMFEFDNFSDASKYMNRSQILELMNSENGFDSSVFTFIERSAYSEDIEQIHPVIGVLFLDYLPGGRQSYIDWVSPMQPNIFARPYLKSIHTYENYYNSSPNRFIQLGFSNSDDVEIFLKDSKSFFQDLDVRTSNWKFYTFKVVDVLAD